MMILLVIPLVSLIGLWVLAATGTVGPAVTERNTNTENTDLGAPMQGVLQDFATERSDTYLWQSGAEALKAATSSAPAGVQPTQTQVAQLQLLQKTVTAERAALLKARTATATAITAFDKGQVAAAGVLTATAKASAAKLNKSLSTLSKLQGEADESTASPLAVFEGYDNVINQMYPFLLQLTNPDEPDTLFAQILGTIDGGQSTEYFSRELTLVGGSFETGGRLSPATYDLFTQTVEQQRQVDQVTQQMLALGTNSTSLTAYDAVFNSPSYKSFQALENKIIDAGANAQAPVTSAQWQAGSAPVLAGFANAEEVARLNVTNGTDAEGNDTLFRLIGAGGVGLLAVIISSLLLLRFGGRVSRELRDLRGAAQRLALQRLPSVVQRLRAGAEVDVDAEAPPLDLNTRTREVTETADAFTSVQRTAVEAAVEQAMLRQAVSNVFRQLARRNQGLLQRQLKMLDEMEQGTHDPDALGQLFRLDHLTTRMRRQAEGLIILSGATPGRRWRNPVPVVEVLRGAISEIEDYVRVDLITDSPDYLQGAGVADVTHLLAELIENAVTYSPPATRVQVRGGRVANGYVVEVEDRGLGLPAEVQEQLNQRLAEPPEFDLADSDQLGLFVVSRLATRHDIKVQLRDSNYGGTLAIVLLPAPLVVSEEEAAFITEQASPGRRPNSQNGENGRGRVAAAMGAAADVLTGKRRSRGDTGENPGLRGSGPMPAAGTGPFPAAGNGPVSGTGTGGLPTRTPGSGAFPAHNGGSGSFPTSNSGGFGSGGGFSGDPGPGAGTDGLPRRQRSEHMAQELRDRTSTPAGPDLPGKSPEQARALMSSIQRGLRSGRNSSPGDGGADGNDGGRIR
jgi:signal transduction histidine kinase